jgi:hypothetical protein
LCKAHSSSPPPTDEYPADADQLVDVAAGVPLEPQALTYFQAIAGASARDATI